jgi:hypothetical protein
MKMLPMILATTMIVSCGKQSNYDDTSLNNRLNDLDAVIKSNNASMQAQYESMLARIVELETNMPVLEIVDPCPTVSAQFREVLVRTNDSIFAYFEVGGQRFLSVLEDGNYRTTDSRACNFSVINGQVNN